MANRKVVFITGVSRGLGKAMALEFAKEGFVVAGTSRSKPDYELDLWLQGDITDRVFQDSCSAQITEEFGRLDVLINNAGIGGYETWNETSEDDLRSMFELNFFAPIAITKKLSGLLEVSFGTVINTSSIAGKMYVPCMGPYCASKAALNYFSNTLRVELFSKNISVLNLITGRINTGFSEHCFGNKKVPDTPSGGSSAEAFARRVFKAYKSGKRELYYPLWYLFVIKFSRLFPRFYDWQNRRIWNL